jgi:hypothetical protein
MSYNRNKKGQFVKGGTRGVNNCQWKGKKSTYFAKHMWLTYHYGKPTKCENPTCHYPRKNKRGLMMQYPSRFEWALLKGKKHDHNRKNYIQLCPSCHRQYDQKK